MVGENNDITKSYNFIKNHPLFSSLPKEEVFFLVSLGKIINFKKDEIIVTEGEVVDSFYFILQGEANVTILDNSGNEEKQLLLDFLTQSETIGLNNEGFFSKIGLRTATVTALTDMQLLKIELKDFSPFLEKNKILQKTFTKVVEKFIRLDFIKKNCPFLKVSTKKISDLAEQIEEITIPAETVLFNQGDVADNCYLIRSGTIEILIQDKNEKKSIVLESETLFGETAILTGGFRNATARSLTTSQLLVLPRQLLIEVIKSDEPTAQSMFIFMFNRLRPIQVEGIIVHKRITPDNNTIMLLHNPKDAQVYRLTKEGWLIWQMINGENTIKDITMLLFKEIKIFAPEMICSFLYNLYELGFVNIPVIAPELVKPEPNSFLSKFVKLFQFKIMFTNIDSWLTTVYHKVVWLVFAWPCQLLMVMISVIGIIAFFQFQFDPKAITSIPYHVPLFILFLLVASMVTVAFHELAHAFTAKHYGYQVKRVGLGWFFLGPIAFADTSELWLATPRQRIMVDLAGIYVDCFFAGLLAIFSFYLINHHPIANFFWIFSLIIYLNSFRNLSPIKDYDGYFAISDYFDKPHLRENAILNLKRGLLFNNKDNIIYFSVCIFYLLIYFGLIFITLKYFMEMFSITSILYIPTLYFSFLIAFISVIIPIIAIALEIVLHRIGSSAKSA